MDLWVASHVAGHDRDANVGKVAHHLFESVNRGNQDIAVQIIQSPKTTDQDLNVKRNKSLTLLHEAAANGLFDVCDALLKHKGFRLINDSSASGCTALHYAAASGQANITKLLLKSRRFTAVDVRDNFKGTPMHDAASLGHEKVLQVLLTDPRAKYFALVPNGMGKVPKQVVQPGHPAEALIDKFAYKIPDPQDTDTLMGA